MTDKPTFVSRDMMTADEGYVQWMADIKQRFRQSQVKAAVRVNTAILEFYWSLGRDMVELRAESKWGSGFFDQLSLDLRTAFPEETGFSVTNLKYMKRWYAFYNERVANRQRVVDEIRHQAGDEISAVQSDEPNVVIRYQAGDELDVTIRQRLVDEKGQRLVDQLEMPEIFYATAVDELLRGDGDNPTVGLIICKSTDKTVEEWSLRDINKPLGVSTYQLEQVVERTVRELELKKENSRK